jgi:hypothetical protein
MEFKQVKLTQALSADKKRMQCLSLNFLYLPEKAQSICSRSMGKKLSEYLPRRPELASLFGTSERNEGLSYLLPRAAQVPLL